MASTSTNSEFASMLSTVADLKKQLQLLSKECQALREENEKLREAKTKVATVEAASANLPPGPKNPAVGKKSLTPVKNQPDSAEAAKTGSPQASKNPAESKSPVTDKTVLPEKAVVKLALKRKVGVPQGPKKPAAAQAQLAGKTASSTEKLTQSRKRSAPKLEGKGAKVKATKVTTSNTFAVLSDPSDMDVEPCEQPEKTNDDAPAPPTTKKIPPIVLRNKSSWVRIDNEMRRRKLNIVKANNVKHGIQLQAATVDDYRGITRMLSDDKHEYHTYELKEDKPLKVVIRGVPQGIPPEEVKSDLEQQGFKVNNVFRMRRRNNKNDELPLVLVALPREQKKIFDLKTVCRLVVSIESLRRGTTRGQCYRCQLYGHTQRNCTAAPRCVKCGEGHWFYQCNLPKDAPCKCANCGGNHPSSYGGCPHRPRPNNKSHTQSKRFDKRTESFAAVAGLTPKTCSTAVQAKPQAPASKPASTTVPQIDPRISPKEAAHTIFDMTRDLSRDLVAFGNLLKACFSSK